MRSLPLKTLRALILSLILLLLAIPMMSQSYSRGVNRKKSDWNSLLYRHWSVTMGVSAGMYYGDLSVYDQDPINKLTKESKLSPSIVVSNKFLPFMAVQGRLRWGRYVAENTVYNRRLDGNAYMMGINLMLDVVNLFSYPKELDPDIYMYAIAGVGLMRMRPTVTNLESGYEIPNIQTQHKADIVKYYGVGANKNLTDYLDLSIELTLHKINSDKLDGVFKNDENDYLIFAGFGIKYNLPDLDRWHRMKYKRGRPSLRR